MTAAEIARRAVADSLAARPSAELLSRYALARDPEAFAGLVHQFGPVVLGTCRRVLGPSADADDAFQAVFVALARHADRFRDARALPAWLHRVALRISRKRVARRAAELRGLTPAGSPEVVDPADPFADVAWKDVRRVLDEELDRLPEKVRGPVVLCWLDGLTQDEAAGRLGVGLNTLKRRLADGRELLRSRLLRRGVAPAVLAVATLDPAGLRATVPPGLLAAATAAARTAARAVPLRWVVVTVAVGAAVAAGLGAAVGPPAPGAHPPAAVEVAPAPRPAAPKPAAVRVTGRVVGPDGRPVAGAKLFLTGWGAAVAAPPAGPDGRFAFDLPDQTAGASINLFAAAPGLGADWVEIFDRPTTDLTLRLPEDEPVVGRVVDPAGKPVAGVGVRVVHGSRPPAGVTLEPPPAGAAGPAAPADQWAYFRDTPGGLAALGGVPSATTDRDGRFVLRGIGRDRYVGLRLTAPAVTLQVAYLVTRKREPFTGPGMGNNGEPVTYQGSAPVIVAKPAAVTAGRVTDTATGRPVAGAVVSVERVGLDEMGVQEVRTVTGADGRYTLPGLPADPHQRVIVHPPAGGAYHRLARQVPDEAEARGRFDFALVRGVPVTVKVVDKRTGKPAPAELRYGVFPDDNPAARAIPELWHAEYWQENPTARTDRAEYRVVMVPGPGLLAARSRAAGAYLTGAGVEAFDAHRRRTERVDGLAGGGFMNVPDWNTFAAVDVPAGAEGFAVTIALDPGATAGFRLVDAAGKPVTGGVAYGLTSAVYGRLGWNADPAAGADFTAVALRAGEVRRVMALHLDRGLAGTVLVVGGAVDPVELRMVPWGRAAGRLVDGTGKPVADGGLLLYASDGDGDLTVGSTLFGDIARKGGRRVYSGPDGRFTVPGLVPGLSYRYGASGPGGGIDLPVVIPKSGETVEVGDIALPAAKP